MYDSIALLSNLNIYAIDIKNKSKKLLITQINKIGDVEGCKQCGATCGQNRMNRDDHKIVNGEDAAEGEIGWQVRIDTLQL